MSRREHLGLRVAALSLLVIAAIWPRTRGAVCDLDRDRVIAAPPARGRFETAAARPAADGRPRPRAPRRVLGEREDAISRN